MKNNFESMEDMQRMQQEAVRRVREMQKRAKQSLAANQNYHSLNESNQFEDKKLKNPGIIEQTENLDLIQKVKNNTNNTNSNQNLSKNSFNFFNALLNDHEKTLILLLILLLIDEGCDLSLVVALIYLII